MKKIFVSLIAILVLAVPLAHASPQARHVTDLASIGVTLDSGIAALSGSLQAADVGVLRAIDLNAPALSFAATRMTQLSAGREIVAIDGLNLHAALQSVVERRLAHRRAYARMPRDRSQVRVLRC